MRKEIMIVAFLATCFGAQAQYKVNAPNEWSIRTEYTKIVDIDGFAAHMDRLSLPTYDIRAGWRQTEGDYAEAFAHPLFGIGLSYQPLGQIEYSEAFHFTDMVSLYGFTKRDFLNVGAFRMGYDLEIGVLYQEAPYDKYSNPMNYSFEGKLALHLQVGLHSELQVGRSVAVGAELSFRHHSTGRLTMPNYGINYVNGGLSVSYAPEAKKVRRSGLVERFGKYWESSVYVGGGVHKCSAEFHAFNVAEKDVEKKQTEFPYYMRYSLDYELMRRTSLRTSSGLAVELHYITNTDVLRRSDLAQFGSDVCAAERYEPLSVGVAFVHEIHYGQTSLVASAGYSIIKHYGIDDEGHSRFYEKVGFRYRPKAWKRIWMGLGCRFNGIGKSDHMELSLGVSI